MTLKYWDEAFFIVVFLTNKLPLLVLSNKSLIEILLIVKLDYEFLKVYGYRCIPFLKPYSANKFQFKAKPYMCLGYSQFHNGYKCLNAIGKVFLFRHVKFYENVFPFSNPKFISNPITKPKQISFTFFYQNINI